MEITDSIKIKNVEFKNRVVIAPTVIFGYPVREDRMMDKNVIEHHLKRAANGAGLFICQTMAVTPRPATYGGVGVFAQTHKSFLKTLADACHKNGTVFFAQLSYPSIGFQRNDNITHLTREEIHTIKNEFVNAIQICREAGCDGVELHGAHGKFLNMFATALSNTREDEYGGILENRLRLLKEICEGVQPFMDDDFILSYRMGWNESLEKDIETAQELEKIGIELLHVSSGIPQERVLGLWNDEYNEFVHTGIEVKKHIHIPVTVVDDIRTLKRGRKLIQTEVADFVAYGKPFLADENFLIHAMENEEYDPCYHCRECKWYEDGKKCPVYRRKARGK